MRLDAARQLSGTARQRRSHALWQVSHDASIPAIARYPARLVSAYKRAPIRDLMTLGVFSMVEATVTGIMMRVALRAMGASVPNAEAGTPPGSGWRGTLLALVIWLLPFVVVAAIAHR